MTLPVHLRPGRWTIEAVMTSPGKNTSSAKRISVFVPKPQSPAISSITLTRRIDLRGSETSLLGPFDIGPSRITPTLADTLPNDGQSRIYFVVYPSEKIEERPRVVIQYIRDGREVGKDIPVIRSDGSRAIPMLSAAWRVPGEYEGRVTAAQGAWRALETTWIRVGP